MTDLDRAKEGCPRCAGTGEVESCFACGGVTQLLPCPTCAHTARKMGEIREECAGIAEAQEEYWREEYRKRGDYRVCGAISECKRVAQAIREGGK